eukprot:7973407-Karenia_brevis.AAC.1
MQEAPLDPKVASLPALKEVTREVPRDIWQHFQKEKTFDKIVSFERKPGARKWDFCIEELAAVLSGVSAHFAEALTGHR